MTCAVGGRVRCPPRPGAGPARRRGVVAFGVSECNHLLMRGLTIRNIDEPTLRWLRRRAADRGRSLNSELLDLLAVVRGDELAARMRGPLAASARRARALGVRTPASGAAIVRASRDARGR